MLAQEFFTPLAFDILWESAQVGELPYPLRVPSHGATDAERSMLRRRVEADLAARGLTASAVEADFALLARPTASIDALHIPDYQKPPVAALAVTDGTKAVLAVQDEQGIRLGSVYPDGLASAVVELLPACPRGTESSLTLPVDEALRTHPARSGVTAAAAPAGGRGSRRRTSLSERASDPAEAYAQLIAQPRLRGGQLAANSRDDVGGRRRSPVLAWFDTATGRYLSLSRTGSDGREWMTVAPADAKTLRTRIAELFAGVTGSLPVR